MANMARRKALGQRFEGRVDGFLVTAPVNVRYVTGFTGSNGAALLLADGTATLTTDGRYATQAADECPDVEVVVTRSVAADLVRRAAEAGLTRLGIERHHVTLTQYDALVAATGDRVALVDAGRPVEDERVVKDDEELASLAAACRVTDEAFAEVLTRLAPGVTERDVAWVLATEMRARGAVPAFDSIVAFGPDSARPHHQPTDRPLATGDLVKLDFGAQVDGYHADMTRTVVLGRAQEWQRELHAQVRDIQARCRAATVVGAVPAELDALARSLVEEAGHECAHGLGHGVGLEIHESPFLVHASDAATLVERVPVTVEPGIYLPGRGGVRIEDTVVVRADGAEPLTTSPRELIEI
jgi:Xaa-Pro aminopeptidase